MKSKIISRISALLCLLAVAVSVCGCAASNSGQKALSLESGWYMKEGSEENSGSLYKGFTDKETQPLSLSELTVESESTMYYSNTFNSSLSVSGEESVVLDIYDALGDITLYINGKEISSYTSGAGRYSFDVTKQIKESGKNTVVIEAAPNAQSALVSPGGMMDITVHAPVSIADVYTVSDTKAEQMKVYVVINNTTERDAQVSLNANIASMDNNVTAASLAKDITAPVGESTHELVFGAGNLIEWSNENPFLYMLTVKAADEEGNSESYSDYVGYKSFAVDESGLFTINGNRILVKCASITADESYASNLYEILNYIKTAGFNTVHVADGASAGRLLEYCDRLGLLVYEGEGADAAALSERDRSHVSLCMAKVSDESNLGAWREAGAPAVAISENGASNIGSVDFDAKLNVIEINASNGGDKAAIEEINKAKGPLFITSGVSGLKDSVIDTEKVSDWYTAFGIDSIMGIGEITDVTNQVNVNENSVLLDYIRAKGVSGLCLTTDISQYKTGLTEVINDDINDLRYCIITDKSNAFNTDTLKLDIYLANFHVLTEGSYSATVKITGDNGPVYEKTANFTIEAGGDGAVVQNILSDTVSLSGLAQGEYTISAEMLSGAHPTCGEKTILIHDEASLAKVSGNIYTAGVSADVTALLTKQGAKVAEFKGTAKAGDTVIVTDETMLEKAMASGANVIVLGAQNFGSLPVDGEIKTDAYTAVLLNNELTKGMVNTSALYEGGVCGDILGDSYFVSSEQATYALNAYTVNADGSVTAGALCAVYEADGIKVCICTLDIEENISNPYAANLLLNMINLK